MVRVANLGVNGTAIPPARHTPMYKEAKRAPGLQTPTDKRPVTHVVCSIREICSSKNDKKRARFVTTDVPLCRESPPLTTTQRKRACMCQARAAGWSKVKMRVLHLAANAILAPGAQGKAGSAREGDQAKQTYTCHGRFCYHACFLGGARWVMIHE